MPGARTAGAFAAWARAMIAALEHGGAIDVACGDCVACCSAAQFVHIDPDDHEARRHIPRALLFPAPGLPAGHLVMGYDEQGRCPMLGEAGCTIYAHRPRTCRTYDCRLFAASGITPTAPAQAPIAAAAQRWAFRYDGPDDRAWHDAMQAAARRRAALERSRGPQLSEIAVSLAALRESAASFDRSQTRPLV